MPSLPESTQADAGRAHDESVREPVMDNRLTGDAFQISEVDAGLKGARRKFEVKRRWESVGVPRSLQTAR